MNVLMLSYGREKEIDNSLNLLGNLKKYNVLIASVVKYGEKNKIKSLLSYKDFQENEKYKHLFYYFYQDRFINELSELEGYVSIDNSLQDMWKNFYRVVNFIEYIFKIFRPDVIYTGSPDNYFVNLFIKIAELENIQYFWLEQSYFQDNAFTFFSDISYSNDIFKQKSLKGLLDKEVYFHKDIIKSNPKLFYKSNIKEKIVHNITFLKNVNKYKALDSLDLMLIPYVSLPKKNVKNKLLRMKNRIYNKLLLYKNVLYLEDIEKLSKNNKLVLLALHYQPEAMTLSAQPLFNNQYQLIKIISDILPPNYFLLVKEHPLQDMGLRPPFVYKQILTKKNVQIVSQNISSNYLIENNYIDRVMSIGGTIGFEELLRRKPSMVFSEIYYSNFKYTFKANLETIDKFIKGMKEFLEFDYNQNKENFEKELKVLLTNYYRSIIKDKSRGESIKYVIDNADKFWIEKVDR